MRERLSLALREAMKVRDTIAVSALRSALSAIANAEAVSIAAASAEGASREAASTEAASTESGPGTSSQYVAALRADSAAVKSRAVH